MAKRCISAMPTGKRQLSNPVYQSAAQNATPCGFSCAWTPWLPDPLIFGEASELASGHPWVAQVQRAITSVRGAAAPILGHL